MWKFTFYFSSIRKFYKDHGIEYVYASDNRNKNPQIREDILSDLKRVFKENGKCTKAIYEKHGKFSIAAIRKAFGKFGVALKEAKLKINMLESWEDVSKEQIVADTVSLYKKYGYINAKLHREKCYSQRVVERHFGGFNNLLEVCGIEKNQRFLSDEDAKKQLALTFEKYGFLSHEVIDENCDISYVTCLNRFGNIDDLYKLIGKRQENFFGGRYSKESERVAKYLEENNISYIREKTWEWLVNPKTGRHLYVDFYLPQFDLCVEYNGVQHYLYVDRFYEKREDFEYRKYLDKLKQDILTENGKDVLVVKYTDNVSESIEKYLSNKFEI